MVFLVQNRNDLISFALFRRLTGFLAQRAVFLAANCNPRLYETRMRVIKQSLQRHFQKLFGRPVKTERQDVRRDDFKIDFIRLAGRQFDVDA